MGTRAERRAERQKERAERFAASREATIAKVIDNGLPKIQANSQLSDQPKLAPRFADAADLGSTNPKVATNIAQAVPLGLPKAVKDGSRFGEKMTWCITRCDKEGEWSWGEPRAWEDKEWGDEIHPKMSGFSCRTWGDLDKDASGTGHRMHHSHELHEILEEAQNRWMHLDLEQFETVFRFRLGAKKRAWGFIVQAHFHMVWWDRNHSIYPT